MTNGSTLPADYTAALVLPTGEMFYGYGIGKPGTVVGEVCFNTAMTGYQEILTDPSYTGQIIVFTFPHIGNVGCNAEDVESAQAHASGLVIREPITDPSNYRSQYSLTDWLKAQERTGISGIDTRALTRHIRKNGACNVAIVYQPRDKAQQWDTLIEEAKNRLNQQPSLAGMELAKQVSCTAPYEWFEQRWEWNKGYSELKGRENLPHVVAIDYGEKHNILRSLANRDCRLTVVPADTTADEIMKMKPDGVFLSNGPGDPAATGEYAVPVIKNLIKADVPIFGICLGHQLLALAAGGKTEKMHQGHRGANHPIQRQRDGRVEITSQNHGFVVSHANLPEKVEVTHLSLFDGTIAGIKLKDKPVFSVQYHPESSPGPHDSQYLFDEFVEMMKNRDRDSGIGIQGKEK